MILSKSSQNKLKFKHMLNNLILRLNQDKIFRRKIFIATSTLGLILLIFTTLTRKSYDQYTFISTELDDSLNYAYLSSEYLYFYNGNSFLKKSLETGEEQTLSSGQYLPAISSLNWVGEEGVLLNFSSGFYYSEVESILRSKGKRINSGTKDLTWYLDFSTAKLSLVGNLEVTNNLSFYNKDEQKLYFISPQENLAEDNTDSGYQLNSYALQDGKTLIEAPSLQASGIKSLVECPDAIRQSASFCLISLNREDESQEKLFSYSQNKLSEVYASKNVLKATSNPNYYISIEDKDSIDRKQTTDQGDLEGAGLFGKGILINLKDGVNSESSLGVDLNSGGTAFYLSPENNFLLIDNLLSGKETKDGKPFVYASGEINGQKSSFKKYKAKSVGQKFDSLFIKSHGYSSNGDILMSDFEGKMTLISNNKNKVSLSSVEQSEVSSSLNSCKKTSNISDIQYFDTSKQFKIFWEDNDNLQANIKVFGKCLDDSRINLYGYNIRYGVVDEDTGKIVSE